MKKFLLLTAIASVASVAAVAPVMAQSAISTITVNAATTKACLAPAAITVALGEYNGTAAITNTGAISFKCTNTTPATVVLTSASTALNGSGELRNTAGTTPIAYSFTGNNTTVVGSGLGTTASFINAAYGIAVAADQNPVPASYTDTINVSVNY